jgi:CMP-N,N'-diacetyllegionaminic acid synthase
VINGKKVLAIIPARGGSKGLPGKNIRPMCGKPLIAWSIAAALKSDLLDCVLVSTDSEEIARVARAAGAHVPFLRPDALAGDTASSYDVIGHAVAFLATEEGRSFDYVVLLEPTSPLREDDDIDRMLVLLENNAGQFDAIVSVGEVTEHPSIMKRLDGLGLAPFAPELAQTLRRQDNPAAYFPYGVAYIAKTDVLLAENTFYTQRCMHFAIQRYQNYEIDDLFDFLCVERVMKHQWRLA